MAYKNTAIEITILLPKNPKKELYAPQLNNNKS